VTRQERARAGDRSRPGRDFREIPGTGGGAGATADPGGNRASRRKHQRETGVPAEPVDAPTSILDKIDAGPVLATGFRQGQPVMIDDPYRLEDRRPRDPFAALLGVELRPTGQGGVAAVCLANHEHEHAGPTLLLSGSVDKPVDLGELAAQAAEHRAQHRGDAVPFCTCPTFPSDGAVRREDDPGCPEHGCVAQAAEKAEAYDAMLYRLARKLGGEGTEPERDRVGPAVFAALTLAAEALEGAEVECRFHGKRPGDDRARLTSGCESCKQPTKVRAAQAALRALAPRDVWDGETA
jgi:hypothetical protein